MNNNIIRIPLSFFVSLICAISTYAQANLFYYLPEAVTYNENIPTPKSVIGHEVGEWHVSHDRMVQYFCKLGEVAERVSVEHIGRTYEYRPLLNVIITSPENHKKLEEIRKELLEAIEKG